MAHSGAAGSQWNPQTNDPPCIEDLERLVRYLRRGNETLQSAIDNLNSQHQVTEAQLRTLQGDKSDLERKVFELEQQLQIARNELERGCSQEVVEQMKREIAQLVQQNNALANSRLNRQAEEDARKLREQVQQLTVERDQYKEWCYKMGPKMDKLQREAANRSSVSSSGESSNAIRQLSEQVEDLQRLVRNRDEELSATRQKQEDAERRLLVAAADVKLNETLKKEKFRLENEKVQLQSFLKSQEECSSALQRKLLEKESEGDVEVYKAALNTYKEDFEKERRDREREHEKVVELEEEIRRLRFEVHRKAEVRPDADRRQYYQSVDWNPTKWPGRAENRSPGNRGDAVDGLDATVTTDGPRFQSSPPPSPQSNDTFKCPSCGKAFSRSKYHDFVDHCSAGCD